MAHSENLRSFLLFFKEALLHPWSAGTFFPSSQHLAKAMARPVPIDGTGLVVEVGAGTGAVTRALLGSGIQPERLVIVERSPVLAASLRARFPQLRIVQGDARNIGWFLRQHSRIDAIVSSVPLRSLPYAESESIVEHWRAVLPVETLIIQYTYALYGPPRHLTNGFVQLSSEITWRNLPPARILTLRCLAPDSVPASSEEQLEAQRVTASGG
ncbi:class I SAM-dependent methyltransferase [Paraburkholderia rhizosphaerae]|uniref:Phospholipid N-methyltransferase n=1 Tax=Paraburkholderia rhizosphaerae TaxID=480658 RepID=A0A4R8LW86_9BURK|nr:methyltransferase domain-containing protein [Paraburkholderia rhizosphaerae]TDY52177.1 phospholipid N-methyltransferase [Paraburkholderia rhizosphaerae]